MFVQLVFPLPFRNTFTYSVPIDLVENVKIGVRAVAPFGKRVLIAGRLISTMKKSGQNISILKRRIPLSTVSPSISRCNPCGYMKGSMMMSARMTAIIIPLSPAQKPGTFIQR